MPARHLEFYTTFEWAMSASQDSGVDRLLFPNYMDFLLFVKDDKYKGMFKETFVLTNAIQHPFQIGMALGADNENMTALEENFLMCMRRELPISERQVYIYNITHILRALFLANDGDAMDRLHYGQNFEKS